MSDHRQNGSLSDSQQQYVKLLNWEKIPSVSGDCDLSSRQQNESKISHIKVIKVLFLTTHLRDIHKIDARKVLHLVDDFEQSLNKND